MISKNDKNIIAALDVGTSKIVTLVAEISEDRSIDIIGYGICESKGLKRGIVVDIEATVESIKKSIGEAERTSGHNILSLVTGIAGNHIRSISSTGTVPITNNEVTQDDLDAVLESVSQTLQSGGDVRLVGFGTFSVVARARTEGRNPRTGEKIIIPASKQPKFKAGKGLKDAVNG